MLPFLELKVLSNRKKGGIRADESPENSLASKLLSRVFYALSLV